MLHLVLSVVSSPIAPEVKEAILPGLSEQQVVPDALPGKQSTVLKLTLSSEMLEGSIKQASKRVLDKMLVPAFKKLGIPHGMKIKGDDDLPVEVSFYDTECWAVKNKFSIIRVRHFPAGSKRDADFTLKHRVLSYAAAKDFDMSTTFLAGGKQCGRHDMKRQMLPDTTKFTAYRSFRDKNPLEGTCTGDFLGAIESGELATAGQWAEKFPGLGFKPDDTTPLTKLKTATQRGTTIGIGGKKKFCKDAKKAVCLCTKRRKKSGKCSAKGSAAAEFEVLAWYDESGKAIGGELTWGLPGAMALRHCACRGEKIYSLLARTPAAAWRRACPAAALGDGCSYSAWRRPR